MPKNRYMTPLRYTNGNGVTRNVKLYFELAPVELADWTIDHPFEANELASSLREMREIHEEESRDLTPDEIQTMLGVIRVLAQISAGKPSEDGEYFLKDPNWISSYAYRQFRVLLLTNPNEANQFMTTLLDSDVMDEFNKALAKTNEENAEKPAGDPKKSGDISQMSQEEFEAEYRRRMAANAAAQADVAQS